MIEDNARGVPQRFGLSAVQAEWLFGLFIAAQIMAALTSLGGRRWGTAAVLLIGLVWVVAALADHYAAFLPGTFRTGLPSRAWVWILVAFQGAAALFAARALRLTLHGRDR